MSLLFDQNISFRVVHNLRDLFPGCVHVSTVGLTNKNDLEIWAFAKRKQLSIVTFDSDFFDISLIKGHPPKIIWIRSTVQNTNTIIDLLKQNKERLTEFLSLKEFESQSCIEID